MDILTLISIAFWISIGLQYLGVTYQYQDIVIGMCALAIGLIMAVNAIRASRSSG